MNINQKILDNIEILKHTTFIEISQKLYRDLTDDTLKKLSERNIDVIVNDKVKTLTFKPYKRDCFAYDHEKKNCKALRNIDCINCNFYNNKVRMEDIERDIEAYSQKL